jgi:hypothetical protein
MLQIKFDSIVAIRVPSDGHVYSKAIELGAVAIVCDNFLIYSKMELLTCK